MQEKQQKIKVENEDGNERTIDSDVILWLKV
jgi:hypothetical protein